jgi:ferredoxin
MENEKLYKDLADHLSKHVVRTPASPSGIKILEILFPEDEAQLALLLPFENKTLDELKAMIAHKADVLEETLNRMIKHGTVFVITDNEKVARYSLLPSVVGWSETPYWSGKETEEARKMAPLWLKYKEEAFGKELARNIPAVRVLPIEQSLKNNSEVLPFDVLKPLIDKTTFQAVAHCPCRLMKKYSGQGCSHSTENCLHFGDFARYMVEQGMARAISKEEALKIVHAADEEGLVHVTNNLEGHLDTICSCCGCCCVFLTTKRETGLRTVSSSNYVSRVDRDECTSCGTCEGRCPMVAIKLDEEDISTVDENLCIGCGVCVSTCPTGAIGLVLREHIIPLPDPGELLMKRLSD